MGHSEPAGLAKSNAQPEAVATGRQMHVLGIEDFWRAPGCRMSLAEGAWLVEPYSRAAMEPLLSGREGFFHPRTMAQLQSQGDAMEE